MQNTLIKVPIVLGDNRLWPSRSKLTFEVKVNLKSKFTHFELVRTITHHPFKLGSPNVDQRCKIPWLRFLLFWEAINRDLQGPVLLKKSNFLVSPLLEIHNHHIITKEPWIPRLLHRPDCFMVSTFSRTYIPRLFLGPDCFAVSTSCTYTDLGSWGYFCV